MIVVIQCAGSKQHAAGRLRTANGKPVIFVAQPEQAPRDSCVYAKPDDLSDTGVPWRQVLLDYNSRGKNTLGLCQAYRLYRNPIYARLYKNDRGLKKMCILSAGWGLTDADFLTPYYDITFGQVKPNEKYKQRRKTDRYDDFCMLRANTNEDIVFFGSKSYVPLFCSLTRVVRAKKTIFYNTKYPPEAPGCILREFTGAKRNHNWQFDCANAFLEGAINVD